MLSHLKSPAGLERRSRMVEPEEIEIHMYKPLKSVVYLLVQGQQNPSIFNEFAYSFQSLRRFHPDLPVFVYHQNLILGEILYLRALPGVMDFPVAVDSTGRFSRNLYKETYGWKFPELEVLASKIDVILLTPGDTLFLDTDTEVKMPLDSCLASGRPMLYESEGSFNDHERDFKNTLDSIDFRRFGWIGGAGDLEVYNTGAIYVPESYKVHLYKAKELLWALGRIPGKERGDNRLDEQVAISIALGKACGGRVEEIKPIVYHYWKEKYDKQGEWFKAVHLSR